MPHSISTRHPTCINRGDIPPQAGSSTGERGAVRRRCPAAPERVRVLEQLLRRDLRVGGRGQGSTGGRGGAAGHEVAVDPRTILSSLHVDDCAEAYVALAELADRSRVAGQTFNIGARRYETTAALLEALAREYGIRGGFRFTDTERARKNIDGVMSSVLGWSQWLGSDKIRMVTGWTEKRMLFAENLSVYRKAYEYAVKTEHDDVARVPEMKRFFRKGFEE